MNEEEIIQIKEKRGKIKKRNLKERIVSIERNGNVLSLEILNMSPNTFVNMAEVEEQDLQIKKLGYKEVEKVDE